MTGLNENARKWVEALRSGKYQQGQRRLRTPDDKFCCLGVACEVFHRETGRGKWEPTTWDVGLEFYGVSTALPRPVREWIGLTGQAGSYEAPNGQGSRSLAAQNDTGASFSAIADAIESQPEGLFR